MAADCLGYVFRGSHEVYFAGDTGLFPEMADLAGKMDVALLPVWGWGPYLGDQHLTPYDAADSLRLLRPTTAIPIHWGSLFPLGMGWTRPSFLVFPPYAFLRHAAQLAPEVAVEVLPVQADEREVSPWEITALAVTINGRRDVYVDQHMQWNLPWQAGGYASEGRVFHSQVSR